MKKQITFLTIIFILLIIGIAYLDFFKKLLVFLNDNFLGVILFIFIFYLTWGAWNNYITKKLYKREISDNSKKYSTKRIFEDGDKNHRDHIYLVDEASKKYYRLVNLYTVYSLGYPRPQREDDKCINLSEGYTIGPEIKIYNIISDIKDISKIKDNI